MINRDSLNKLLELAGDDEFKERAESIADSLDHSRRISDIYRHPADKKVRLQDLKEGLSEEVRDKAEKDSAGIALILNGGGAKGCYQAGVFKALSESPILPGEIRAYSGTSAGALNAAVFSAFGPGKGEELWSGILENKLMNLNDLIYPNLENDRNLELLIRTSGVLDQLTMEKALVSVSSFNMDTAYPKDVILNDLDPEKKLSWLMASAAYPVAFEKQFIDDQDFVDGGIPIFGSNMPVAPLYHLGFRRFIVVHCSSRKEAADWAAMDRLNISLNEEEYYNGARFVHIYPSRDLGGLVDGTMNFDHDYIMKTMELGYEDALRLEEDYRILGQEEEGEEDPIERELARIREIHMLDGVRFRNYREILEELQSRLRR